MKLQTTWNEHGKIWHYFTTPQEAKLPASRELLLMPHSASGVQLQRTLASPVELEQRLTHLIASVPSRRARQYWIYSTS